ncbi:MAG: hypothetical protein R3316_09785 [Rhodovibrionaceae bacterium]|nr:hypothetical protein [Rhodovibrionaceae bacterium]
MGSFLGHEEDRGLTRRRMRLRKWWIDDDGTWREVLLDHPDPALRTPIPATLGMEATALRQFGFMKVGRVGPNVLVKWDLRQVAEDALGAFLESLSAARGIAQVLLYFYIDGWCRETCPGPRRARERIGQIQRYSAVSAVLDPQTRAFAPDEAMHGQPLLRYGFDAWRRSEGRLQNLWSGQRDRWLLDRSLVVAHSGRDGKPGFAFMGPASGAVKMFGTRWMQNALGAAMGEAIPQIRYQSRMADAYQAVLEAREPQYDHVRARLTFTKRGEPVWTTYQRLLLPCVDGRGEPAVLGVNDLTENVDIPFLAGG